MVDIQRTSPQRERASCPEAGPGPGPGSTGCSPSSGPCCADSRLVRWWSPGRKSACHCPLCSHRQGYRQKDYFIATQGPLAHTVEDFWRMVWEWRCHTIVMLTEVQEREQVRRCPARAPGSSHTRPPGGSHTRAPGGSHTRPPGGSHTRVLPTPCSRCFIANVPPALGGRSSHSY